MNSPVQGTRWRNWSGLAQARADAVVAPGSVEDVRAAVAAAREAGGTTKMTGTGHSFTDIAAPEGTLMVPGRLRGVVSVDRSAMTVTALAGTPSTSSTSPWSGSGSRCTTWATSPSRRSPARPRPAPTARAGWRQACPLSSRAWSW